MSDKDGNMYELFARDPRTHSDEDVLMIIEQLRVLRPKFVIEGKASGPRKVAKPRPEIASLKLDVKL